MEGLSRSGRDAGEYGEVRKGTEEWGGVRRGGRNGVKCGGAPRSAMECGGMGGSVGLLRGL
eukprot:816293-Pyramimonas_sp.AAC.1